MPNLFYSEHISLFTCLHHSAPVYATPFLKINIISSYLSLYLCVSGRPAFRTFTTISFQNKDANDIKTTTFVYLCDMSGIVRLPSYHRPRSFCLRLPNVALITQYPCGHILATFPRSTMIVPCHLLSIETKLVRCFAILHSDISVSTFMAYVVLYWYD